MAAAALTLKEVHPLAIDTTRIQARKRLEEYAEAIGLAWNKDNVNECYINPKKMPLIWSASKGDVEIIRTLVDEYKADIRIKDRNGWTPLHYAVMNGHIEVIKLLMAKFKVDANAQSNNGCTPLHSATTHGRIEVVRLLVNEYAADASAQTALGHTPLHIAAQSGHIEIIKLLATEYKVNPGIKDISGKTARCYAIEREDSKVVDLFDKLSMYA